MKTFTDVQQAIAALRAGDFVALLDHPEREGEADLLLAAQFATGEKLNLMITQARGLVTIALPRVRDFRGISGKGFDGQGNYNMGVKEQIIFPEIEYDKIDALRGMNISITTTAKSDAEAKALLGAFKFPFKN